MYFSILRKKEIILDVDCSAQKLIDSINENIENKKGGWFADVPEEPFCGEFKDGMFILELNEFCGTRSFDFSNFQCLVTGDENKSQLKIIFKNEVYKPGALILFHFTGLILCFFYKWFVYFYPILLGFVSSFISFNWKMNKCMDEIEFIINKILLEEF